MRRGRRGHKPAEGTAQALAQPVRPSPPELFVRAGGGDAASNASSTTRQDSNAGGTTAARAPSNRIPPGMGTLPTNPPEYVRQMERRVPSIEGSTTEGKPRSRLRSLFKRGGNNRRGASNVSNTVEKQSGGEGTGERYSDNTPSYEEGNTADYEGHVFQTEAPQTRLQLCDLKSKGRFVRVADEVSEVTRVHDNYVSFVVPHGWRATRTPWGFYLSSKLSIGFVMASSAKDASKLLVDPQRLCVFSQVRVMASPVFESRHTAVVHYAAHDISGRG